MRREDWHAGPVAMKVHAAMTARNDYTRVAIYSDKLLLLTLMAPPSLLFSLTSSYFSSLITSFSSFFSRIRMGLEKKKEFFFFSLPAASFLIKFITIKVN